MIIKIELDKDLKTNEVISINVVKSKNKVMKSKLFEVEKIRKGGINKKAPISK